MQGNPEKSSLVKVCMEKRHVLKAGCTSYFFVLKVLEPLLKKLSPSSWDILNASVMWNVRKPVWFQVVKARN